MLLLSQAITLLGTITEKLIVLLSSCSTLSLLCLSDIVLSKTILSEIEIVPRTGLEPAQPNGQQILSLSCLPISPSRHPSIFIK